MAVLLPIEVKRGDAVKRIVFYTNQHTSQSLLRGMLIYPAGRGFFVNGKIGYARTKIRIKNLL